MEILTIEKLAQIHFDFDPKDISSTNIEFQEFIKNINKLLEANLNINFKKINNLYYNKIKNLEKNKNDYTLITLSFLYDNIDIILKELDELNKIISKFELKYILKVNHSYWDNTKNTFIINISNLITYIDESMFDKNHISEEIIKNINFYKFNIYLDLNDLYFNIYFNKNYILLLKDDRSSEKDDNFLILEENNKYIKHDTNGTGGIIGTLNYLYSNPLLNLNKFNTWTKLNLKLKIKYLVKLKNYLDNIKDKNKNHLKIIKLFKRIFK